MLKPLEGGMLVNAALAQNELTCFYQTKLKNSPSDDPWIRALKRVLLGEVFEPNLLSYLSDLCADKDVFPRDPLMYYQRNLYSVLLNKCAENHLKISMEKPSVLEQKKICLAYYHAAHLFIEEKGEEKNPFFLGNLFEEEKIPDLSISAQLSVLYAFLGIVHGDERLCDKSLQIASLLQSVLDHQARPFRSIWHLEKTYSTSLISWFYTLFYISSHLYAPFKESALKISRQFEFSENEIPHLPILITYYFDQFILPIKEIPKRALPFVDPKAYGFFCFKEENLSIVTAFSGIGGALGAIHKDAIQIVAHGPHFHPLGETEHFGIFRSCMAPFDDICEEVEELAFKIKGWCRLVSPNTEHFSVGDSWIDHQIEKNPLEIKISSRFYNLPDDKALSYVFFIKASQACIDEKQLKPRSLDQYRGRNLKACFYSKHERLSITPNFMGEMQIIPLAADHHFWGAEFLVSFKIEHPDLQYTWVLN